MATLAFWLAGWLGWSCAQLAARGVAICVHAEDAAALAQQCGLEGNVRGLVDGEVIGLGGAVCIRTLHTPGHTPGSACFAVGGDGASGAGGEREVGMEAVVTGDTLFVGAFGRVDLPNSNATAMFSSLERLRALPPQSVVLPGHNYGAERFSTIENECARNLAFRCQSAAQFRMLAGVDDQPAASKYDMGDKAGARTSRRHGGRGGGRGGGRSFGAGASAAAANRCQPNITMSISVGTAAAAAPTPGAALGQCPCATQLSAERVARAGLTALWCSVVTTAHQSEAPHGEDTAALVWRDLQIAGQPRL